MGLSDVQPDRACLGPPEPSPATPYLLSPGRALEVTEGLATRLGQRLFLVWDTVMSGASPPRSVAGALPPEKGLLRGEELPAEPWASQHGWVKTLSQARLTFPRGTRAWPAPPAQVALGPRASSQLPRAA